MLENNPQGDTQVLLPVVRQKIQEYCLEMNTTHLKLQLNFL